ncbi:MFS family permease [Paraburkholderia bannensis]|uniref:MFS family permease n=1 Tax=Paraburkholderia bannensis TaxID=765414 RepID=A0A7W9TZ88_9BURK|nr:MULTISPECIES: MFS transporter [Paraburkholderia]MBB3259074.1 MFS family permease [Paraburkholderia sp. WP4_3_2]MBB6104089.1 MFS family permease [Paraburkholderia bannensis]
MKPATPVRWPAIAALTGVSTFAQIGQFGIGFIVLPVWLAHQGLDAQRAGIFAASQWAGMLAGLVLAPALVARSGAKRTVTLGLAASVAAFLAANWLWWPLWIVPGVLSGLGIGLRWIANESWLYSLVPEGLSGRVVGVHETLIASAGVIAPALAAWCGPGGNMTITAGVSFTCAAAIPLWLTASTHSVRPAATEADGQKKARGAPLDALVYSGMIVVAVGGLSDGALYGLFPLYAAARSMNATQAVVLLSWLGLGGMALQYPVGWMADRVGLAFTVVVCAILSTLALAAFALAQTATWMLPACGFAAGSMNSAFITLGMYAAACSDKTALIRNMRLISLTFTASSIVGPLVASAAMKAFGNDVLMWPLAIASASLALFTLGICEGRRQRSAAAPAN